MDQTMIGEGILFTYSSHVLIINWLRLQANQICRLSLAIFSKRILAEF